MQLERAEMGYEDFGSSTVRIQHCLMEHDIEKMQGAKDELIQHARDTQALIEEDKALNVEDEEGDEESNEEG